MGPQVAEPMAIGAGIVAHGAYVTKPTAGSSEVSAEIWSVQGGASKRIATVEGPDVNVVSIADVSADGGLVLLSIGHVTGGGTNPECIDLYLLKANGSTVTRLTKYSSGSKALGGRISPDGRYVAFHHNVPVQSKPRSSYVIFDDQAAQNASREFPCGSDRSLNLAWEPTSQGLAAVCAPQLVVADQTGSAADLPFVADQLVGLDWQSSAGLIIAAVDRGGSTPTNAFDVWTLKFVSAASFPGLGTPKRLPVPFVVLSCCVDPASGAAAKVSPDGRSILVPGFAQGDPSGDLLWYSVRLSDGTSTQIVPALGLDPSWSADSRSVVYVKVGNAVANLVVHVVATGAESVAGALPAGYAEGVWHPD